MATDIFIISSDEDKPNKLHNGRTCSVANCARPVIAKSLCSSHYERLRSGRPLDGAFRIRNVGPCIVDGCDQPADTKGFCKLHYERSRRGVPLDKAPVRQARGMVCEVEGCDSPAYSLGICRLHYNRKYRGVPLDGRIRYAKGLPEDCSVHGCDRKASVKGMCGLHHHRLERGQDLSAPPRWRNVGLICLRVGCDRHAEIKGLCKAHYYRTVRWSCDDPRIESPWKRIEAPISGTFPASGGYVGTYVPPGTPGARRRRGGKKFTVWYMSEHRYVMQKWLCRPLLPQEQVHHRDGNRANNHIDNLELKSGAHGSGINIIDGMEASLDWIERYANLDLLQREALASIREMGERGLLGKHLAKSPKQARAKSLRKNSNVLNGQHAETLLL